MSWAWLTSSGSTETFRNARHAGMGLLTHLLGQDIGRLADGLSEYRKAAAASGREGWRGHVVLMVHTDFVRGNPAHTNKTR